MNPIKRAFWRVVGRLIGRKQWCYSPVTGEWRKHTYIGKNFIIALADDPKWPPPSDLPYPPRSVYDVSA